MTRKSRSKLLLAPRYWPSWILMGMLRVIVLLPYPLIVRVGRALGTVLRVAVPYRRKVVETNLGLCFPELDEQERDLLSRKTFSETGISLLEMALCWWAPDRKLSGLSELVGLENLHQALEKGKGVILLTGHFTSFEIAGWLLTRKSPMCVTYREFRNPVFHHYMVRARSNRFEHAIHRYDTRGMIQALRDNRVVWYAADQDPGAKHSVFAPFFGIKAATLTTTARLARLTGACIVPFSVERVSPDTGYRIVIGPALANFPQGDPVRDATTLNQIIEEQLRKIPEQYYWVHRRFKTRPPGEPGFYTQKPRRLKRKKRYPATR